ncbi:DUF317 domain-containing protein [Streptomyces acidiscabies]|uniref:DUF317 domain-containing protein n=1 Tax=Streptomyces acidiscabies TaxID=42234 RepID=A0AAP6BLQ3_9ACTN|nr:DUF317 domain-containing protein [Streptomyces acidiscabies]MBZ3915273.1 DUF317 domain-containing protein [Streptomyces acidiscabies]MDX2967033.1 DUF317 domain-containing protein [Streptomyces acidiscabies]MDX3021334.1 DUF317 domain-containing protein [Streptomyces acidiscabies]MDX3793413.1 DUF317 domain-containing protein [Streptomyces acidiscabies]
MPNNPDEAWWREYRVTPGYLAGSSGIGDPGFASVPDTWPRFTPDPDDGRFIITSPDRRIQICWDGDGLDELWRIGAYDSPVADLAWVVTANHNTPPEFIGALTKTLADDYEACREAFLNPPGAIRSRPLAPLLDAGWKLDDTRRSGDTLHMVSPDRMAGLHVNRYSADDRYVLWANSGRNQTLITFSATTPDHLVSTTLAAFSSPRPLLREHHMLHPSVRHAVRLEPITPPRPTTAPTPLDVRRTAVTAALLRAHGGTLNPRTVVARSRSPRSPASAPSPTSPLPSSPVAPTSSLRPLR